MVEELNSRLIQSFGRRKGRPFTKEKEDLIDNLLPGIKIKLPDSKNSDPKDFFDIDKINIADKEIWLEIGFGDGEHLFHNVVENPDILMIGGEVYAHGIASLLKKIASDNSAKDRIRIFADDIRLLLATLNDNSIDKIFVLFPDPWPKKKQNKRRLLNSQFFEELSRVMKSDSVVHIATDHHEYAEFILQQMYESSKFEWMAKSKNDWLTPNPHHIETKYQLKNKAETDYPVFLNFRNF